MQGEGRGGRSRGRRGGVGRCAAPAGAESAGSRARTGHTQGGGGPSAAHSPLPRGAACDSTSTARRGTRVAAAAGGEVAVAVAVGAGVGVVREDGTPPTHTQSSCRRSFEGHLPRHSQLTQTAAS